MANSSVGISTGSDASVDVEELAGGDVRQVVVVGDPSTENGVAPVDGTAGLKVDLGSDNDVTVTGTVTANLSATDNAVLDSIQTATEATQAAVEGTLTVGTHAVTQSGAWTVALSATDNAVLDAIEVTANAIQAAVEGTLTVSGTVTANLSATDNAVLDQIDSNTDFGAVTGGGTEASALRVTVANDSTGLISVDDGGGSLTVDGTVGVSGTVTVDGSGVTQPVSGTVTANLGATDNAVLDAIDAVLDQIKIDTEAIETAVEGTLTVDGSGVTQPVSGTVTANLSATDNAVLDQIDSNTDFGAQTGGGTEAAALRVTIANNSTGLVSVDDNGGSLTVDGTVGVSGTVTVDGSGVTQPVSGTVTANLSATDNAVLDAIQAAVETIDNAISGSEMQVDIVNTPTVTANLSATDNAVLDNILTALQGIEDVTEDADDYDHVAASSDEVLGATGATGDYLAGVLIIPATLSPGSVDIGDGATDTEIFAGGTDSLLTLHPFFVPLGIKSTSGAWSIITGANVAAVGVGRFT